MSQGSRNQMTDWDRIKPPLKLARSLWSVGNLQQLFRLPPERFEQLFARVYESTDDLETLWRLGGATNDYLRANPEAFRVPVELPRRLLASNHMDARIIGLKLLNRCPVDDEELVREFIRAMNRRDGDESCGGIFELSNFLDKRYPSGGAPAQLVHRLLEALEPLVNDGEELHSGAASAVARLRCD